MPDISYQGAFFKAGTDVTPAVRAAARRAQDYGMMVLRGRTPVDTGALKASWASNLVGNGYRITNSQPYASYVENGTRYMAGRHMLSRTIPDMENKFRSELQKEVGKSLGAKIITRLSEDIRLTGDALTGKASIGSVKRGNLR